MRVCLRQGMHAMLQRLELMENRVAVESPDVLRLRLREPADGPGQMHEVRLDRMRERMHPDFVRQPVALARVAR